MDHILDARAILAMSFYMSTGAKVLIFLHIPILFADYLMDSYQFQSLKGSTSCYFMRIICLFHSHTPFLSPSPARGMFRFGDMVSDVSFYNNFVIPSHKVLAMASGRAERQKVPRKSPRQDRKSVCRGESLNKCSEV